MMFRAYHPSHFSQKISIVGVFGLADSFFFAFVRFSEGADPRSARGGAIETELFTFLAGLEQCVVSLRFSEYF